MTEDARFEDGAERPLRLKAETPDDLAVLSALLQDAVGQSADISWLPRHRRLVLLVNRFRWEDAPKAERQGRPYERVRALLVVENAARVRASGIDPRDRDLVISILALGFEPGEDGAGVLRVTLAGDGELAVEVEALDVALTDVTRPYAAPSGREPVHPEDPPG
jgi:hypothetical protein